MSHSFNFHWFSFIHSQPLAAVQPQFYSWNYISTCSFFSKFVVIKSDMWFVKLFFTLIQIIKLKLLSISALDNIVLILTFIINVFSITLSLDHQQNNKSTSDL